MSITHGSLDQGLFSETEIFCVMERKCLNAFLDSFAVSLFTNSIIRHGSNNYSEW